MTTEPESPAEAHPSYLQKFFGCVAMAFGALMVGLCGLCTGRILWPSLWGMIKGGGIGDSPIFGFVLIIALAIDAIPLAIGIFLILMGLRMYRK